MFGIRDILKVTISQVGMTRHIPAYLSRCFADHHRSGGFLQGISGNVNMQKSIKELPGKPALLIIDMQNDFVKPGGPPLVTGAHEIIHSIADILTIFRKARLPIFHIVRVHRSSGVNVEITRRETFKKAACAVEGTRGAAVIQELAPEGVNLL